MSLAKWMWRSQGYILCKVLWSGGLVVIAAGKKIKDEDAGEKMKKGKEKNREKLHKKLRKNASFWVINLNFLRFCIYYLHLCFEQNLWHLLKTRSASCTGRLAVWSRGLDLPHTCPQDEERKEAHQVREAAIKGSFFSGLTAKEEITLIEAQKKIPKKMRPLSSRTFWSLP